MSDTQRPDERVDGSPCYPFEPWREPELEIHMQQSSAIHLDPKNQPTPEDLGSREFKAVWNVIKGWDIQRSPDAGYAGATGSDVMRILNALNEQEQLDDR